jgi:hypothetical protein
MGIIRDILGLGRAVESVAEVFVPNKTAAQSQAHLRAMGAQAQFGAEFQHLRVGQFDRFVDGLNRLPRPVMALGTVGLFCFAMADPISFGVRMQGLSQVPDPLWWLLGAIVSFYFGAREMHHLRQRNVNVPTGKTLKPLSIASLHKALDGNAALDDWNDQKADGGEVS